MPKSGWFESPAPDQMENPTKITPQGKMWTWSFGPVVFTTRNPPGVLGPVRVTTDTEVLDGLYAITPGSANLVDLKVVVKPPNLVDAIKAFHAS